MLGSKLRSWMDAVRPKKKQQKKEKHLKSISNPFNMVVSSSQSSQSGGLSESGMLDVQRKPIPSSRYSGATLSSPESAYSTGYSTDGTSPSAPPDCLINCRTATQYSVPTAPEQNHSRKVYIYSPSDTTPSSKALVVPNHQPQPSAERIAKVSVHLPTDCTPILPPKPPKATCDIRKVVPTPSCTTVTHHSNLFASNGISARHTEVVVNSVITSPRQRNRIRTNPWLPGSNVSPELHLRHDILKVSTKNSPVPVHYVSPMVTRSPLIGILRHDSHSISSSSCSSLSSLHWEHFPRHSSQVHSGSEEEDCTINEMMGKFDESYIYEKETDILSDSDPTDCDTDIDAGRDGGDEDDALEYEFDFIDNGSHLDFPLDESTRNTGHCSYFNFEGPRKTSRRRTGKKQRTEISLQSILKPSVESKRNPSKRRVKIPDLKEGSNRVALDGSRSAGATPTSSRRSKNHPVSKLAFDERLKRRSNSVSFSRSVMAIDQRDKEADKKYKELIVEAEHILIAMKASTSPHRLPNPANKRVELLRNAESVKPDAYLKNRLIEDTANLHLSRIPSINFSSPRFSPKKNHITNFINNNSPILMRRETDVNGSPLLFRKEHPVIRINAQSPLVKKKISFPKTDLMPRRSPKNRRRSNKCRQTVYSSDSDSDDVKSTPFKHRYKQSCPQSEPLRRKVYDQQKFVCYNYDQCNSDTPYNGLRSDENKSTSENLRQQVLLNTIVSLKRNLEDQSASLRQVYRSSQNIRM